MTVATDLVDLAAVLYAVLAVSVERGINIMLWAIEKQRQRKAKWNAELWVKILTAGRAQGLITSDDDAEAWRKIFEQNGIALDELPTQPQKI
jgi:cobalamin biosynthesis Co2+ chelatase CbiK